MARRVIDKQTGDSFVVITERRPDRIAALVSIIYTLAVIVYLSWLLLDTWIGKYPDWFMTRYKDLLGQVNYSIFKLVIYTAIGGGMGAAVNNIRSFVYWHAELNAFGRRFVWKYLSMPPLGAVLAVMVYAIVRGGTTLISGSPGGDAGPTTSLAAWVTGALAGYGSGKVLIWLDDKVNTLFKVEAKAEVQAEKVVVPDLSGKTRNEAEQILNDGKLVLGDVSEVQAGDEGKIDKVISQTPQAGAEAARDSKVAITIGKEMGSQAARVTVPDLSGKIHQEAAQILKDGKLALGDVSEVQTSDEKLIGKVISQTPQAGAEAAPDSEVAITIGKATEGVANVTVPDLSGKTQEEAVQTLKDGKLALGDVSTEPTTDVELIDKVISQTPAAGAEAAPDSKVAITIGTASEEVANVTVPDLSGKTQEEAAHTLKDGKLALGDVSKEPTTDVQLIDKVISQTPAAATEVAPDSKVATTIGKASEGVANVTVPDLSGKTQEEAVQTLKDGKLALGDVSTEPTTDELIDKVISQTPAAGAEAAPDSKVAITIGKASDG